MVHFPLFLVKDFKQRAGDQSPVVTREASNLVLKVHYGALCSLRDIFDHVKMPKEQGSPCFLKQVQNALHNGSSTNGK